MKRFFLLYGLMLSLAVSAQEPPYDYSFFVNSRMEGNYFFSRVSYQQPSTIKQFDQKLPVNKSVFHTPGNSLQLDFVNGKGGSWQAAIYKQKIRGQDHFKAARYLSFWIYVVSANTSAEELPVVHLMKKDSSLSPPFNIGSSTINQWKQVRIPIEPGQINPGGTISDFIGLIFAQHGDEGENHRIFLDDLELIPDAETVVVKEKPVISLAKGYARHVDLSWTPVSDPAIKFIQVHRSEDGNRFEPVGIQAPSISRYTDFTGQANKGYSYRISFLDHQYNETGPSSPVVVQTREMTDEELLDMVQEACFRYYWEGAEPNSGLAKENIPGRMQMVASGASGFGLMAILTATERKFITRDQAVERFTRIVTFLEKAETFHGAFPHFIDGTSGKVEPFFGKRDNGGDLVETSFLIQGLLAARSYFDRETDAEKIIRDKITGIWERVEWDWYRRFPGSDFLYWHWSPDQAWVINHRLIGWNETMVTYLLAIASPTHAVPASMYYTGWASQDPFAQQYRKNWGGTEEGSMYKNGNSYFDITLDVGVSNGGPLFFTHYSYLGYDPHHISDRYTNYFTNNRNIALINYRYCQQNPNKYKGYGPDSWGLTASDGPYRYSADEPVPRQDRGKMAPTGAISSFPYTPEASMKALKNYYFNHGRFLWGEYGFRDAFNLQENWCSEIFMGLNQAPMVVMIENHRSGLLWNLFMKNAEIKKGLQKLEEETKKQVNKK